MADGLERLAAAFAREREEGVEREEIAGLDASEQSTQRCAHVGAVLEARSLAHLHLAHVHVVDEVLHVVRLRLAVAQDVEHRGLGRRHVGLVERAHLHEVAAHGDGVLPHDEMLGQLVHGLDLERRARDGGVDVGQAHLEVVALVPQVVLRLVHDDAAVARVLLEQQRVDLDVGQDALAVLADALGDQLLDPQAEHAAALLREEAELVATLHVVVVQEGSQADGRVVDGVLAAGALRLDGVLHELLQVDAHERGGQQAEHGHGAEAAAHGGLAGEHRGPALLASLLLELGAGIGDGHQMLHHFLVRDLVSQSVANGAQRQARLDGAARFGGHDEQRGARVNLRQDAAHANRGVGIERAEAHQG